jgi:hypothetical protein
MYQQGNIYAEGAIIVDPKIEKPNPVTEAAINMY